jgi:hypothetical protein
MASSIGFRDSVSFLLTIQATGFLTIALVGLPPTEYASLRWTHLHVQSNAALSGALNVQVNPKHPPASGASYTALTAGSLSGSFTSVTAGFTLTTKAKSIQVTKQ